MDTLKLSARLAYQTTRTFEMKKVPRLPCMRLDQNEAQFL
jgi:hypothetical protein